MVAWVWERGSPDVCIARFCGDPSGFSFVAGAVGMRGKNDDAAISSLAFVQNL